MTTDTNTDTNTPSPPTDHRPLEVDVWSDVACPWCYIGKRRLEEGARRAELDIVVRFHSYELSPESAPQAGLSELDLLTEKFGSRENAEGALAQVTEIAASDGLSYHFDTVVPANTLDAHQVIQLAQERGVAEAAVERIFAAHFTHGEDVGDQAVLAGLAREVGLDPNEVASDLAAGAHVAAVRADEQAAVELGITGVPFFVINGRYAISGAQPADLFADGLRRAAADRDTPTT